MSICPQIGNYFEYVSLKLDPPCQKCALPHALFRTEDSPEEPSVVSPPPPPSMKAPQQQGEEGGNDSSEPSSPPPDDSFSSGGEQLQEEGGGIYLPHGGQLSYWMLPSDGLVSPTNAEVMLAPSNTPPAWSNSAPTSAVFDDLDPEFLGEGQSCVIHLLCVCSMRGINFILLSFAFGLVTP